MKSAPEFRKHKPGADTQQAEPRSDSEDARSRLDDSEGAETQTGAAAEFKRRREREALDILGCPNGYDAAQAALRQFGPALEAAGFVLMRRDGGSFYAIDSRSDAEIVR